MSSVAVCALLALCLHNAMASTAAPAARIENDVLHFSYELERLLDAEQQPCQNFYGYVCARSVNTTNSLREQRKVQQKQRFEKFLAANNDEQLMDMELKLKQFYQSCQQARGKASLCNTPLYHNAGGWPAIEASSAMAQQRRRRNMTWLGVLANFHEAGLSNFFETRIEIQSNKRVIQLQPDVSMRNTLRKYEQLVGEVMTEYAVDAARTPLVALEILNFERNRREIAKADVIDDDVEFTYANFRSALFGSVLQLDWDAYFRKLLGKTPKVTDAVVVKQLPKLVQYFELLQNTTMNRLLNWLWIDYLTDKTVNDCEALVESHFGPVYEHIVQRVASDKVQMAQMYAELGHAYDELLPPSSWIDEISQQNSKQFLGRILHLTLNGDSTLDADYQQLPLGTQNFYRNLEALHRFTAQQRKRQRQSTPNPVTANAKEFMQIFRTVNALLQAQNLSAPLNYLLVGARFAEHMIAGGSSTRTPGAWRSMDSERDFGEFKQCSSRQNALVQDANDLLLKLLAQHQSLQTYERWLAQDVALQQRLDTLLAAGRLRLSLKRLYYVSSVLVSCRQLGGSASAQLVHGYLRNTPDFSQAFNCRAGDALYASSAAQVCKVL